MYVIYIGSGQMECHFIGVSLRVVLSASPGHLSAWERPSPASMTATLASCSPRSVMPQVPWLTAGRRPGPYTRQSNPRGHQYTSTAPPADVTRIACSDSRD